MSLQFYPQSLDNIFPNTKIEYKGKVLCRDYIVDLLHNLLFKYKITKKNSFHLNSKILRKNYGKDYNYYIDFLLGNSVINLEKNYSSKKSSRVYSLSPFYLLDKTKQYPNENKNLLKKKQSHKKQTIFSSHSPICPSIREGLVENLSHFSIDYKLSVELLKLDPKNMNNLWLVDLIDKGDHFYHFDSWGRMHTSLTILPRVLRKEALLIDGEKSHEIDITNSQVLFLKIWIEKNHPYLIEEKEFQYFDNLVKTGTFYEVYSRCLGVPRKRAKVYFYEYIFGKEYPSKNSNVFKNMFPEIHQIISEQKKQSKDYKFFSGVLQRMESDFVFGDVVRGIWKKDPSIILSTIHDSIIFRQSDKEIVSDVFYSKLNSLEKDFKFNI